MGVNSVSVEGPVGGTPADVYRYIADMTNHHPRFVPPRSRTSRSYRGV
jgi:hypothetical protein